jgi:predicted restriction endonuclease
MSTKGIPCSDEKKEKLRQSNLGKKHNISPEGMEKIKKNLPSGWNKGMSWSSETREKIRQTRLGKKASLETRIKKRLVMLGTKNHNYKHGKSADSRIHYNDLRYKLWREAVYERDNYICQKCFIRGGYIEAHHIKGWTHYPQLRYELGNGITLCKKCHSLTDNYRGRKRTN